MLRDFDATTPRLERALATHIGKTVSWTVHTLAARHGVSVSALRDANGIPVGMKPVAGSALLLPVAALPGTQTHAQLMTSAQLQTTPDVVPVYTRRRVPKQPQPMWLWRSWRIGTALRASA
ncbi:MAG: hypothetical protein V4772_00655 [Pseudomonadota bacterium]